MTVTLSQISDRMRDCRRCDLCDGRTNIVFGVGDPHAHVMLIGEAPGKNEDLKGEPFVGAAGKLLDELLGEAGLRRSEVFIANILKCRPPGNRDPRPPEIEACTDYLRDQVRAVHPDILVTLGNFSTKFILKTEQGITRLHGTINQTGRFTVLPMYHPAAALYDPTKREVLVEDFRLLGKIVSSWYGGQG